MDFEDLRKPLKAEGALGFESAENHQWRHCRLYPWGLGITAQSSILSKNLSIDHLISEKIVIFAIIKSHFRISNK